MSMKEVYGDKMNEEKAVAIMMANLKQSKSSNLLEFAQACRFLRDKWGFKEMSDYFKTSSYMLRQIDKINELDLSLQKLVKEGKLKIESSYQLWRIPESKRNEVVKIIQNLPSNKIREFVYYVKKHPNDIEKAKRLFEKGKDEKIKMLVLPLTDETFKKLQQSAKKSKKTVHDYVLKLVEDGLYGKE